MRVFILTSALHKKWQCTKYSFQVPSQVCTWFSQLQQFSNGCRAQFVNFIRMIFFVEIFVMFFVIFFFFFYYRLSSFSLNQSTSFFFLLFFLLPCPVHFGTNSVILGAIHHELDFNVISFRVYGMHQTNANANEAENIRSRRKVRASTTNTQTHTHLCTTYIWLGLAALQNCNHKNIKINLNGIFAADVVFFVYCRFILCQHRCKHTDDNTNLPKTRPPTEIR